MQTATSERDQAGKLAKSSPVEALSKARAIKDPWFRAQALAWIVRFSPQAGVRVAKEAAKTAADCDDAYKKTAVRAWEIAALAEIGATAEASAALDSALTSSRSVTPSNSRAEALFLLAQAAAYISGKARDRVCDELVSVCGIHQHWRCRRAVRDALALRVGDRPPRAFFW